MITFKFRKNLFNVKSAFNSIIIILVLSVKCYTQTYKGGELKTIEGIPFLKLYGSYYDMGEQYGYLMRDLIQEFIEHKKVKDYYENKSHPPKWLLKLVTPNRYLDFIEGISDGSGIPYDDVFWLSASPDPEGCSSILTKFDGKLLLGHNQDRFISAKYKVIIEFNPNDCLRYVVTSMVGTYDVLEGMNEKGICIANNAARPTMNGFKLRWPSTRFMPHHCKNRQILEYASTIQQVDSLMENYVTDAATLTVASIKDGSGIIYDKPFENIKKNYLGSNDFLFVTNTYLNKELDDHPGECVRYKAIQEFFKNGRINSVKDMIDHLLANPGTLYGVNNHNTIHSIVFDPENLSVYMAFSQGFAALGKWLKYDLQKRKIEIFRKEKSTYDSIIVKKFDGYKIISIRDTLESPDKQSELWKEMYGYLRRRRVNSAIPSYTIYHNSQENKIDLETVIPITATVADSGRIRFKILDSVEMACIIHKGTYKTLSDICSPILKWIEESNYDVIGQVNECHLKGSWNEKNPDEWLNEIRIPIRSRK